MTDDDIGALQARIAEYATKRAREADAYRMTFHFMLGWLDRPRQVDTADIAVKIQAYFDQAVL